MEKSKEIKYDILTNYLMALIEDKGYINTEDIKLILKVLNDPKQGCEIIDK